MPAVVHTPVSEELRQHTPRRDIQGLRAVAVIVVVAFHAGLPVPGGFVGVDIFFVISGFVITGMLLRELTVSGTIRMRRFYGRRVKRLIPALTLVLLTTLLLTFLLGSPFDGQQTTTAATAIGAILMFANGVIFLRSGDYFATPPTNNPLLNTWSLSVEEQFYLVFPTLLLLLWWWSRRRLTGHTVIVVGLMIGVILSFALSVAMTFGAVSGPLTDPAWFAFYSSPTRAWEFGVGALVWFAMNHLSRPWRPALSTSLWWTGVAGIVVSVLVITESSLFPGWIVLLPVLSTALVLAAGQHSPWGIRALTNGPMVAMGDVSYSWYLWHWPLIAFSVMLLPSVTAAPLIAAVLSLVLAALSLRFVENPIRFSGIQGSATVWLAVVSVTAVVALSTTLILGSRAAWGSEGIARMKSEVSSGILWIDRGCNTAVPVGVRGPDCRWNDGASGSPVMLLGDSIAGALGDGLLAAAQESDRPLLVGTKGACPFADVEIVLSGQADAECTEYVQSSMEWLATVDPTDVILSISLRYPYLSGVQFRDRESGAIGASVDEAMTLLTSGIGRTVKRLTDSGHRVTVVLPPPGFPEMFMDYGGWLPSECSTFEALSDAGKCGATRSGADVGSETGRVFAEVADVVTAAGGRIVDPAEELCQDGTCATNNGFDYFYRDGSHLSPGGSLQLKDVLASALDPGR